MRHRVFKGMSRVRNEWSHTHSCIDESKALTSRHCGRTAVVTYILLHFFLRRPTRAATGRCRQLLQPNKCCRSATPASFGGGNVSGLWLKMQKQRVAQAAVCSWAQKRRTWHLPSFPSACCSHSSCTAAPLCKQWLSMARKHLISKMRWDAVARKSCMAAFCANTCNADAAASNATTLPAVLPASRI